MTKPILTSRTHTGPSAPVEAVSHRYRPGAVGFTLLELMVSVAIMAIIALAFGGLMTQANLVVTEGEKRMRSDAAASAISRVIRGDIRKITKNGFFRINDNKLVLVTAGKMQSSFGNYSGNGAIIVYGLYVNDGGTDDDDTDDTKVLYRKVLVLAKNAPADNPATADIDESIPDCLIWKGAGVSLADLQVLSATEMTALIEHAAGDPEAGSMVYPPQTLKQVTRTMWTLLAGNCTELNISYRPPDTDSWAGETTCLRYNQTNWPDAIKFRFKLKRGALMSSALADDETGTNDVTYEIICTVGH